jgi:hypothetical protein
MDTAVEHALPLDASVSQVRAGPTFSSWVPCIAPQRPLTLQPAWRRLPPQQDQFMTDADCLDWIKNKLLVVRALQGCLAPSGVPMCPARLHPHAAPAPTAPETHCSRASRSAARCAHVRDMPCARAAVPWRQRWARDRPSAAGSMAGPGLGPRNARRARHPVPGVAQGDGGARGLRLIRAAHSMQSRSTRAGGWLGGMRSPPPPPSPRWDAGDAPVCGAPHPRELRLCARVRRSQGVPPGEGASVDCA